MSDGFQSTLQVINRMQAEGVIGRYAIGGAVGATFYLEPFLTDDVDVFTELPGAGLLTVLTPIYDYLTARGFRPDGERIVVGEWPVQFLSPADDLQREAIDQAVEADVAGEPTRVMRAEHLVAIALQTGRAKDYARIVLFLQQGAVDRAALLQLLQRFGLEAKWERFRRRFLEEGQP